LVEKMNIRRWQVVITITLFLVFGSAFFLLFRFVEKNSTKFEQWIVSTYKSIFYKWRIIQVKKSIVKIAISFKEVLAHSIIPKSLVAVLVILESHWAKTRIQPIRV
jgi:hypothetical protein